MYIVFKKYFCVFPKQFVYQIVAVTVLGHIIGYFYNISHIFKSVGKISSVKISSERYGVFAAQRKIVIDVL